MDDGPNRTVIAIIVDSVIQLLKQRPPTEIFYEVFSVALDVLHSILRYAFIYKKRMQYEWKHLWYVLVSLGQYLVSEKGSQLSNIHQHSLVGKVNEANFLMLGDHIMEYWNASFSFEFMT